MGSAANLQYYILKLTLVVSATLFWLVGLAIVCVGTYAEVERQRNKTLGGLFVAPAVVLLLLGSLIFSVAFVGMVGALRDNKRLLRVVSQAETGDQTPPPPNPQPHSVTLSSHSRADTPARG
uniref:Uncharacterized protein n=1 Tax=Callorhinchus milii TaxID=7868 RepID=A0A4W3I2W5_CALMI